MLRQEAIRQTPKSCEWCGKFVVAVLSTREDSQWIGERLYEFYLDEVGRLVKNEDDLFLVSKEHICRAACSRCGKPIIMDRGKLFDRPSDSTPNLLIAEEIKAHECN